MRQSVRSSGRVVGLKARKGRTKAAYRRLADMLRDAINQQTYTNGRRLPTETTLAQQHHVSRQTVRRAYQELVAEGYVRRTPGRGTFATPTGPYLRSTGSMEDILAFSAATEMQVVEPLAQVVDAQGAGHLGLHTRDIYRIGFQRVYSTHTICFSRIHAPVDIGRELAKHEFLLVAGSRNRTSVLRLVDRPGSVRIRGAKLGISPLIATEEIANLIECSRGSAIVRVDCLYFDESGRGLLWTENFFNPVNYHVRLEVYRIH